MDSVQEAYVRLLKRFHQCCLCTILNMKWQDYVSNVEVLVKVHISSIEAKILKHQLRWAGHVSTMENTRLGELREGKGSQIKKHNKLG